MDALTQIYDAYVDTFRDSEGKLPEMMQLKRVHTDFVVKNARLIADGEGFAPEEREVALAAALLHDTGRYEQLKRFNTFRDGESIDHAVFSHDIVKSQGWLGRVFADASEGYRQAILNAVLYHNRRVLPDDMDPLTAVAAHTVRDADKLDIFRVLEERLTASDWRSDTRAFWSLPTTVPPSPSVIECVESGKPVAYQQIMSLSDFVLIQVGWMISGLHFAVSRRLCRERNHLEFRRRFLHKLSDSPEIDRLCDLALFAII